MTRAGVTSIASAQQGQDLRSKLGDKLTKYTKDTRFAVPTVCNEGYAPVYAHIGDAGADLRAHITGPLTIEPGQSAWVGTGVKVELPTGYVGLQFPRSGLGCNHGICLANGVGVIDSGYRGEIKAKLLNLGQEPFTVLPSMRICQLVIVPFERVDFHRVDELGDSERGEDGYGSTGVE